MDKQLFTSNRNIYLMVFLKYKKFIHVSLYIIILCILHLKKITEFSLFITSVTLVLGHDKHKLHHF